MQSEDSIKNDCKNCIYRRKKSLINPFSNQELANPKILELKLKWDNDMSLKESSERHRIELGHRFSFQPQFFSYCEYFTNINKEKKTGEIIPATGEFSPYYEICNVINKNFDCKMYKGKE